MTLAAPPAKKLVIEELLEMKKLLGPASEQERKDEGGDLHIYPESRFPVAFCGHRSVFATFEEACRCASAGRDRCAECVRLFTAFRAQHGLS